MYLFMRLLTHVQPACMCVFHSVRTLSSPSFSPSVPLFFPSLALSFAVGTGRPGVKSASVPLGWWVTERQLSPTVCKYVVTLIERSSSSQQLSFLLLCVCMSMATAGAAGDTWHWYTLLSKNHTYTWWQITEVHLHAYTPRIQWLLWGERCSRFFCPFVFPSFLHTSTCTQHTYRATLTFLYNYRLWDPSLKAVVWLAVLSLH